MTVDAPRSPRRRSEARERLLATASQLFYAEGIGGVGVDRIVSEANVTLATFYRHFPSKEDLVIGYLEGVHALIASRLEADVAAVTGPDAVRVLGDRVIEELGRKGFRGCAFINAASEYEDPESRVRQVITQHRRWYYELIRRAFAAAGHTQPASVARLFVMLRDGAMTGGGLDSQTTARRTFKQGIEGLLRYLRIDPVS
jgi:AcrR family transcriptional regulator